MILQPLADSGKEQLWTLPTPGKQEQVALMLKETLRILAVLALKMV